MGRILEIRREIKKKIKNKIKEGWKELGGWGDLEGEIMVGIILVGRFGERVGRSKAPRKQNVDQSQKHEKVIILNIALLCLNS